MRLHPASAAAHSTASCRKLISRRVCVFRTACRQRFRKGFAHPPYRVDQIRPAPYQQVSRPDHLQRHLLLPLAVHNRVQHLRTDIAQLRQFVGVPRIVLVVPSGNVLHLMRVATCTSCPHARNPFAHSARLAACFHRHPAPRLPGKKLLQFFSLSPYAPLAGDLAFRIQNAYIAVFVAQIDPDKPLNSLRSSALFAVFLYLVVIIFMPVSFVHLECVTLGSLTHPVSGDRPSHTISALKGLCRANSVAMMFPCLT